ncbi:hypothetical protein [Brumimicrobium salinarum]|nr:hypothetical protein [Brumimicrobium salinarum]
MGELRITNGRITNYEWENYELGNYEGFNYGLGDDLGAFFHLRWGLF